MAEKPIPSDVDAEEAVLGSILIDPERTMPLLAGFLEPSDFYREKNAWLYEACLQIHGRLQAVTTVTIANELQKSDRLEAVGGVAYLSQLVASCPTSVFAEDHARLVRTAAFSRRLISAGGEIARIGWENGDPDAALGKAQEQLLALAGLVGGSGLKSLREVALEHSEEIEAWAEHPERLPGVSTSYPDLDAAIGGFEAGRLYVLAARPSMGKSQLALMLAVNIASQGQGVVVFTLEMSELAVLFRMVLAKSRLNRYAVRLGEAGEGWQQDFYNALGELTELPIWIDESSAITTGSMRSRVALLRARKPDLGLVIVDYGDLVGDEDGDNEEQRITRITRRLADMAKGLSVAVLGVYQLNRNVEARLNKRPMLADLRSSGSIEQRADVVMMMYRPAYYREQEGDPVPPDEENLLELWVRKQRDGATGLIKFYFDKRTGFIGNWQENGA